MTDFPFSFRGNRTSRAWRGASWTARLFIAEEQFMEASISSVPPFFSHQYVGVYELTCKRDDRRAFCFLSLFNSVQFHSFKYNIQRLLFVRLHDCSSQQNNLRRPLEELFINCNLSVRVLISRWSGWSTHKTQSKSLANRSIAVSQKTVEKPPKDWR